MGKLTNSNIHRTVTDGPFSTQICQGCMFHNKKEISYRPGVTLPALNQFFSSGAIVMHLGVTNCYWGLWGNFISGSVQQWCSSKASLALG